VRESVKPIALTLGDPAGIGPEIVAKVLASDAALRERCIIVGDTCVLDDALKRYAPFIPPAKLEHKNSKMLMNLPPIGVASAQGGRAAYGAVIEAAKLCASGECSAMVTAPISKTALKLAGIDEPGHTEILAKFAGTDRFAMMFARENLNVLLATIHLPLRQAIDALTTDLITEKIALAHESGRWIGVEKPRIAVAGLNPHAGEDGLLGSEDDAIIAPAVALARKKNINAVGPIPPDTVFMRAWAGEFDIVVAMYHDQGLIPVKLLGIEHAVNVTVGLPFLRASVDHGTAFDIAGKGIASEANLRHVLAFTQKALEVR
jgi:4-phospho-D-threonate 3-dehydrogenase / 4-phospho-D-erythronate 3-dehydrogenase